MVLEHYISELLYRYNCVTVPTFGAFLTQRKSAVIHSHTNSFYPPSKVVSFNEQVQTNDGLLISYVADAEKESYEDMLLQVTAITERWKEQLNSGERLKLQHIGELWLNESGKIQFLPLYDTNYLTASFGMSSFVSGAVIREELKAEVETIEEKIPFVFTPEEKATYTKKPYLKYAAIFLLTVSLGLTSYRYFKEKSNEPQWVQQEAQEQVNQRIQQATFFDTEPIELPVINLDVITATATEEKNERVHHIVAGAFRFRRNANKKIKQLSRRGFNASYIGTNKFGLHMVNFDSYTDVDEALNALKNIKQTQSKDAWLLSAE